jgi:hypothetical protein
MEKNLLSALLSLVVLVTAMPAFSANRYAVANGEWGITTTWSATPGGPAGASIPTAADTVYVIGFTVGITKVGNATDWACYNLNVGSVGTGGNINMGDNGPKITLSVGNDINVVHGVMQVIPVIGTRQDNLTLGGNLTVNPAGRFDMFGSGLQDYCVVNFNGGDQVVSGGGQYELVDVTINNNRVNVFDSLAILGDLVFVGGLIELEGVRLVVNGSFSGIGDFAYIITDQPGSLVIKNNVTTTTRIPIGTATRYLPIDVSPVGGASTTYRVRTYEVATMDGVQGTQSITSATGNQSHRVEAVWEVAANPARNTDVRATWKADLEGAYFATRPGGELGIAAFTSGSWGAAAQNGGTGSNNTNTVVRTLSVPTSILPISVGLNALVLPIKLANFSAVALGNQVKLNWSAYATHINSSFDIERSANGTTYTKLGTKNPAVVGESKYEFLDASPVAGNNYYRIKTIDENGKIAYSKSILVKTGARTFALNNLYPSIAVGQINLVISSSTPRSAQVNFIDLNGKVAESRILSIGTGNNNYPLSVSNLPSGVYTVVLYSNDETITTRFVKQ